MKTETIIQKLIAQAERYGIENPERAIRNITDHESPRCGRCGRPMIIVDITGTDCFFISCPNDAHHDGDMQIRI